MEWFRDDDGGQVQGMRAGNVAQGPYVGNFWDITLGVNWTPRSNLVVRNEVRWDWYDADAAGGPLPFDSGDKSDQFLYAFDVILLF